MSDARFTSLLSRRHELVVQPSPSTLAGQLVLGRDAGPMIEVTWRGRLGAPIEDATATHAFLHPDDFQAYAAAVEDL